MIINNTQSNVQNVQPSLPATMSASVSQQDLLNWINDPQFNAIVEKQRDQFVANANQSISLLEKDYNGMENGPVKTDLKGAITALKNLKNTLAGLFKNITTYSLNSVMQTAATEMNNINAVQQSVTCEMNLQQQTEEMATSYSTTLTAGLQADAQKVQADAGPNGDQNALQADTTKFNFDNTVMQNFSTYFNGQNSMLSNGEQGLASNISTGLSVVQQSTSKILEAFGSIVQAI